MASRLRVSRSNNQSVASDEAVAPDLFSRAGAPAMDHAATLTALVGIAALTVRRWLLIGPYPPGLDGAQWLALGRGFHGVGRSTEGAYAPLTPLLATMTEALIGPLPALRLLALVSWLAIALAIWLLARDALGPLWGPIAAGIAIPASALAEPSLYGGYPQQFALAAGIVALWATGHYLTESDLRRLWFVGSSALISAAAHHIYFPLMLLSLLAAVLIWSSTPGARRKWHALRPLALAMIPACALCALVAYRFMILGYQAPLQASERSIWDAWHYATREAPLVWLALVIVAIVSLAFLWRSRATLVWLSSASLMLPSGFLFLLSGQPRLLPPLLIGTTISFAVGVKSIFSREQRFHQLPLLAVACVAITLMVAADRATADFAEFYRVVDQPLLDAAVAIERDGGDGAVAVRQDKRGWPIGWWFEALQTRPVIVGSDTGWLGFPEEQKNASLAAALFDGGLDPASFRELATASDIDYLVMPKWDWIGWDRWLRQPDFPVTVLHDDDHYLVLRVNR